MELRTKKFLDFSLGGIFIGPCIHVAEVPPCRGNNVCIAMAVAAATGGPRPDSEAIAQPLYWLAPGKSIGSAGKQKDPV
jgi:hypothetical protein